MENHEKIEELSAKKVLDTYKKDGWIQGCKLGDCVILEKGNQRVSLNLASSQVVNLIDDSVERYQKAKGGGNPNYNVLFNGRRIER